MRAADNAVRMGLRRDDIALGHGLYLKFKLLADGSFRAVALDGIASNPTLHGSYRIDVDVYPIGAERTECGEIKGEEALNQ